MDIEVPSSTVPEEGMEEQGSDRTTKKVKLRLDPQPDLPTDQVSFRDKLMGSQHREEDFDIQDDVGVDESDFQTDKDDEMLVVRCSEKIHKFMQRRMRYSVIVKVLGTKIGYLALVNRLHLLWRPTSEMNIVDMGNDFFTVKLGNAEDYTRALCNGPWGIRGSYLAVQTWRKDFDTSDDSISSVIAWVRLPGLPLCYYSRNIIMGVTSVIGKFVKLDTNTGSGQRGKYARVALELDLSKPLVAKFMLDGMMQPVLYENLPLICLTCGRYGHLRERCPAEGKILEDAVNVEGGLNNSGAREEQQGQTGQRKQIVVQSSSFSGHQHWTPAPVRKRRGPREGPMLAPTGRFRAEATRSSNFRVLADLDNELGSMECEIPKRQIEENLQAPVDPNGQNKECYGNQAQRSEEKVYQRKKGQAHSSRDHPMQEPRVMSTSPFNDVSITGTESVQIDAMGIGEEATSDLTVCRDRDLTVLKEVGHILDPSRHTAVSRPGAQTHLSPQLERRCNPPDRSILHRSGGGSRPPDRKAPIHIKGRVKKKTPGRKSGPTLLLEDIEQILDVDTPIREKNTDPNLVDDTVQEEAEESGNHSDDA